jgi:hypothetical protein
MANRRPIFYRKEKPRSVSKTGLLLCLLLAGGVVLVPASGDVVQTAKLKLRDYALSSGLVDFEDCVVTAEHTLSCSSHAVGTPLAVALRRIEDSAAEAAAEKEQRLKAEKKVHELALDIERLNGALKQAELAADDAGYFAPPSGDMRPTGLTITNPSTGSLMTTKAAPQPVQAHDTTPASALTPPADALSNGESVVHD